MDTVTNLEDAKQILSKNPNLMIRMDNAFACWIQEGTRDCQGNLVANGQTIAALAENVFHELAPEMEQVFCSEYFQPTFSRTRKSENRPFIADGETT